MHTFVKNFLILVMLAGVFTACRDDDDFGPFNRDNRAEVPVTFPNATTYGFNPFVQVSAGGAGTVEFTMQIPEASGRTIQTINRVVAGPTAINAGTVRNANSPNIIAQNIPVNATQYTFTTNLAQLREQFTGNAAVQGILTPVIPSGATYTEMAFMFLITLDDGTEIIPVQTRARVVP
jgi:hypothetical protein